MSSVLLAPGAGQVKTAGNSSGQMGGLHEIAVAFSSGTTPLIDGPDDQTLTAPHVPSGEDAWDIGRVRAILRFGVATFVPFHTQLFEDRLLWPQKAHGQQHEIGRPDLVCPGDSLGHETPPVVPPPRNIHRVQFLDVPVLIPNKFFGLNQIHAGIITKACLNLLMTVIEALDAWPLGPGVVRLTRVRGTWQDFKLHQALTLVTHGRPDTVRASIATPNDDHVLVGG